MEDLKGRVALVTGSSRGIGRAIAIELARAGCHVAVHFATRSAEAEQVRSTIAETGRRCVVLKADVANAAEISRLIRDTVAQLGTIDILVNNAGAAQPKPFEELSEQDWDDALTINLKSAFLATQAVVSGMRTKKWGRIINVSSVAAQVGGVVGPHYAASKAGMLGLTHFYAQSLVKDGITSNAITPALIDTDMVRANPNAKADRIPVGRFGSVDEVAGVAVMLARNGYITGQTINVNGGWVMS